MDSPLTEYCKAVTMHVLDCPAEFKELTERFAACEYAGSKAAAAAIGYLIGKDEGKDDSAAKVDKKSVYDLVIEQVEDDGTSSVVRTDAIFSAMCRWMDSVLAEEGYDNAEGGLRDLFWHKLAEAIPDLE